MTTENEVEVIEKGSILLQFVLSSLEDTRDIIVRLQKILDGLLTDRAYFEIIFLRAFAVDYITTVTLGDSPKRNAILDAYYELFKNTATSSPTGPVVLEGLLSRLHVYAEAVDNSSDEDVSWTVGKTFAQLFDQELNFFVVLFGKALYNRYHTYVAEILKSETPSRSEHRLH